MDILQYYGLFAYSILIPFWLVIVAAPLVGHRWRPRLALTATVLMALGAAALMANDRWGSVARHKALCEGVRQRYEQATTLVDLERARDRMREARCPLTRPD
jgi:hypothetical protein